MARIDLKKEECLECGLCKDTCPYDAIYMSDGFPIIDAQKCTLCGACVDACPAAALIMQKDDGAEKADLSAYSGVCVIAEQREGVIQSVTYELLGKARELADKLSSNVSSILLGSGIKERAEELIALGADKVYVVDAPELKHCNDEPYTKIIVDILNECKPEIVLCGATSLGRSLIPRVATKLNTGLTADCTGLDIDADRQLLQTRPAFGGNIMATIICPRHRPQMATVRHKVMKPAALDAGRKGEVITKSVGPDKLASRAQIKKVVREQGEQINLADAEFIVAGGRGLGSPEKFSLIEDLAKALNGAVGATRAAVDANWISYAHQIGQTGKTVCPKIYIACGISGQVQHMAGMSSADIIIAINKDPDAPIFDIATYGIVGDLFEVVPSLTKKIKELAGTMSEV